MVGNGGEAADQVHEGGADVRTFIGSAARVLVIDDESSILELFKQLLLVDGVQVDTALDAESALAKLRAAAYDLLVIDKNLPGLGGLELLYQARQLHPGVECIMITAYPSDDSKVTALLKFGAFDYLEKPFGNVLFLRQRLQQALAKGQLATENRVLASTLKESQDDLEELRKRLADNSTDLERLNIYVTEMVNRATLELQYSNSELRQALGNIHQRLRDIHGLLGQVASPCDDAVGRITTLAQQALHIAQSKLGRPR